MLLEVLTIDVRADVVTDALTAAIVNIGVDMLADVMEFIILPVSVIALEFAVPLSYPVDVPVGMCRFIDGRLSIGARADFVVGVVIASLTGVFPDIIITRLLLVAVPSPPMMSTHPPLDALLRPALNDA